MEKWRKTLQKFESELKVNTTTSTEQTAPAVNVPAATEQHYQVVPALGISAEAVEAYMLHPQHSIVMEAPNQVLSTLQDSSTPAGINGYTSAAKGLHHKVNVAAIYFKPSNTLLGLIIPGLFRNPGISLDPRIEQFPL